MKHLRPAIVLTLFFIVITGLVFPVVVWAIGRVAFPTEAAGSLIRDPSGKVRGSTLLGQSFSRPEYFHPRPSTAGAGYDAANSSGSNLGPTSDKLVNGTKDDPTTKDVDETYLGFRDLAKAYRVENGLAPNARLPRRRRNAICERVGSPHQSSQRRPTSFARCEGSQIGYRSSASPRKTEHERAYAGTVGRTAGRRTALEPSVRPLEVNDVRAAVR